MKRFAIAAGIVLIAGAAVAAEIGDLSTSDASNTARFPENMNPGLVNDGARALEGMIARWRTDEDCTLVSTGTSSAFSVSATRTLSAYYDGLKVCFTPHSDNDGALTLNVDSIGTASVLDTDGAALEAGALQNGQPIEVVYDGSAWRVLSPLSYETVQELMTTQGDLIRGGTSGVPERLGLGNPDQVLTVTGGQAAWADVEYARGYLYGGILSNNGADADHDIDVTAGVARGADDDEDIDWSALTKRADASWASGTGNGGLSSSLTLSNDTFYWVHAINVDGASDVGFDTSYTAANLVTDHSATAYRPIGWFLTDGSANVIAFKTVGNATERTFLYQGPDGIALSLDSSAIGTSATTVTLKCPTGVKLEAIINAIVVKVTTGSMAYIYDADLDNDAASTSAAPLGSLSNIGNGATDAVNMRVTTNTSSQVDVVATHASTTVRIATLGCRIFL